MFGDNPKLLETLEIAEKAAPTDLPVLVRGESGTGKRNCWPRWYIPMVGVVRGRSFPSTAAPYRKIWWNRSCSVMKKGHLPERPAIARQIESANLGTIFSGRDRRIALSGQVKLLRVLQSQEIQRVGSDSLIKIDARIVAATNRDLLAMVGTWGQFREDLYYRLSVIEVTVPPFAGTRDEIRC